MAALTLLPILKVKFPVSNPLLFSILFSQLMKQNLGGIHWQLTVIVILI